MMWRSATACQPAGPVVVAVAGVAGSGKSTLGRALATALAAPLLDLDSLTNPLLDSLPADALGGHWLASPHSAAIRDGRYAALRAVARDTVATAGCAVLVAPFTAELRGGPEWDLLREAVGATPTTDRRVDDQGAAARRAPDQRVLDLRGVDLRGDDQRGVDLRVVHLVGADDLFAARRAGRDEIRDRHRVPAAPELPAVPVISIDAGLTTGQQLHRVLAALGPKP